MQKSFYLAILTFWSIHASQAQVVRPTDLDLSEPNNLAEIIEKAQEVIDRTGGVLDLGPGTYELNRVAPIFKPLLIRGDHPKSTRINAWETGRLVLGWRPEPDVARMPFRVRNREGDRQWLASTATPITHGKEPTGWAEFQRVNYRISLIFPTETAPAGTYLCAADEFDRPHFMLIHLGENQWEFRTTTGTTQTLTQHVLKFQAQPRQRRLALEVTLDLEGGKARISVAGTEVATEVSPAIPPGARLRGCLFGPLLVGAVGPQVHRDVPQDWVLPPHGEEYDWALETFVVETDQGPLAALDDGPGGVVVVLGPAATAAHPTHCPTFLVGPANQVDAHQGGSIHGIELSDLTLASPTAWSQPLTIAMALEVRLQRVETPHGSTLPVQTVGSMPVGHTWFHEYQDCRFAGWDAAIVATDQMVRWRGGRIHYPGRQAIRARGAVLYVHDVFLGTPADRFEHVVYHEGRETGGTTDVRRVVLNLEHLGTTFRSFVYHEMSRYLPNRLVVQDCWSGVPPSVAIVEVVAPEQPQGLRPAEWFMVDRNGIDIGEAPGVLVSDQAKPWWSTSRSSETDDPDSPP